MERQLADIWSMEDQNDLVIAMGEYIDEKCQYGDEMSALSEPEHVFFVARTLEMEVNSGGFGQFFFNSSGDFANELVHAFTEIGACKTAEICTRALAVFETELPVDRDEREEMLDELESDEIDEALEACDDAFLSYEEDLNTLNYAYIMKNKASFT